MKQKYIVNKGFSVKYDLESLLLCFDYFNHGLTIPKKIDSVFIRKLSHKIARLLIMLAYILKLYGFKYKIETLNEDAIVIFKGIGKWPNTVKLLKIGNKLKVIKITNDKKTYLREKKFYEKYKNNSSQIKFPKSIFKGENTIEIEFLKFTSFQRQIRDGSITLDQSIMHFNAIKKCLKYIYKDKRTLVHGDLCPENIYFQNNNYILIDFADSHINTLEYDLYTLLERILFTSIKGIKDVNEFTQFKFNNLSALDLVDITPIKLEMVKEKIFAYKVKRFPERFLNS